VLWAQDRLLQSCQTGISTTLQQQIQVPLNPLKRTGVVENEIVKSPIDRTSPTERVAVPSEPPKWSVFPV